MCTTIDPPAARVTLPEDIARLLIDAQTQEMTGHITLHFVRGEIGAVEHKRQRNVRRQLTRETKRP